jgi:hypothetical protein
MMMRMSEASSIPSPPSSRVVRVSTLHGLDAAVWCALIGWTVFVLCARYLSFHIGEPHQQDALWGFSSVGLVYGVVFGVLIPALVVLTAGTWIADERGIEFIPYTPRLRKWQFLLWSEVARIRWTIAGATLDGDGITLKIPWNELRRSDRELLKSRVRFSLSERFDLTIYRRPRPSFRTVVRIAALPVLYLLLVYGVAIVDVTSPAFPILIVIGIMVFGVMTIRFILFAMRDQHDPARWRMPRA